jgi:hypothetical protein
MSLEFMVEVNDCKIAARRLVASPLQFMRPEVQGRELIYNDTLFLARGPRCVCFVMS